MILCTYHTAGIYHPQKGTLNVNGGSYFGTSTLSYPANTKSLLDNQGATSFQVTTLDEAQDRTVEFIGNVGGGSDAIHVKYDGTVPCPVAPFIAPGDITGGNIYFNPSESPSISSASRTYSSTGSGPTSSNSDSGICQHSVAGIPGMEDDKNTGSFPAFL